MAPVVGSAWLHVLRSTTAARTAALLMTGALLGGAVFVAPVAATPPHDPAPVASAPDAKPKDADEPVVLDPADEVPELRTATSRTYDLGDGQFAVESLPDPVFYQPEGGDTFEPIDLDFTPLHRDIGNKKGPRGPGNSDAGWKVHSPHVPGDVPHVHVNGGAIDLRTGREKDAGHKLDRPLTREQKEFLRKHRVPVP